MQLALGAHPRGLQSAVLRQALSLALTGIGLGVAGSLVFQRALADFLFQISPLDPLVLLIGGLTMVAAAALGSYLPARRAASVHPMEVMRE